MLRNFRFVFSWLVFLRKLIIGIICLRFRNVSVGLFVGICFCWIRLDRIDIVRCVFDECFMISILFMFLVKVFVILVVNFVMCVLSLGGFVL